MPAAAPAGVRSLSGMMRDASKGNEFSAPPGTQDYRIGDEWGKMPVTKDALQSGSAVFQRAAKATAYYGSATAFYLGKFNGRHIMATNYHVSGSRCKGSVRFYFSQKSFPCVAVYGSWKEVDLALFSIQVPPADEAALLELGRNFAYDSPIYPGQELLTVGFGVAGNPRQQQLMANQDSDCKVFSDIGDFRLITDPDEVNPGGYSAWSFANGCDVSHGDSGSAFIDRKTGDVLGLVWTGKIPKSKKVGSSAYLDGVFRGRGPEIWTELTFSVPAAKIREHIRKVLAASPPDADMVKTLSAVIGAGAVELASR